MHVVLFYDGTKWADISIADDICTYWETVVTGGRGYARNHNRNKAEYAKGPWGDATGQVDRHRDLKRESLRTYLTKYIAKTDQHPDNTVSLDWHTFGTSQLPVT